VKSAETPKESIKEKQVSFEVSKESPKV